MPLPFSISILNMAPSSASRRRYPNPCPAEGGPAMKLKGVRAVFLLLASWATIGAASGPAAVDAGWLAAELRKGGYLVYFRHTSTYREDVETEARNSKSG